MNVIVNGAPHEVEGPATVAGLLAQLKLPQRGVAVELNLQIVPRPLHGEQQLVEGDRLEIVSLVGGG